MEKYMKLINVKPT